MYSVVELSKIFKVSRNTIYAKLSSPELTEHTEQTEQGLRLKQEGFQVLAVLLGQGKTRQDNNSSTTIEQPSNNTTLNNFEHEIIEMLKARIEELKQEKEELKKERTEIQLKYDNLVNMFIEQQNQQKLLEDKQGKEKKGFLGLFKK